MSVTIDKEAIRRSVNERLRHNQAGQAPLHFTANSQSSIHHVVGVVSGKGGVGKSLVCGAAAIELARAGYKVGILDADITGPSIPKMFGFAGKHAYGKDDKIIPLLSQLGIKIISTNLVIEKETDPVLWRGPMLMGAIKQFFEDTLWGEIDYLLVDMPPGTGDVALTVFQSLPINGVIVVSSPQDLVQMVVGKALTMAQMMDVPTLGLVENMSYITCPDCNVHIYPFGESRLVETAEHYDIPALDRLPIMQHMAQACDEGTLEAQLPKTFAPQTLQALQALDDSVDAADATGTDAAAGRTVDADTNAKADTTSTNHSTKPSE